MNFWELISVGSAVLGGLAASLGQLAAGQTVSAPGIRTYIGGRHVELDITVKPLQ